MPTMALDTGFRPSTKMVGASAMPNLPAMLVCIMLLLQTYLALANPAAAAAAALFPGYRAAASRQGGGSAAFMIRKTSGDSYHYDGDQDGGGTGRLVPRQPHQSVGSACDGSEGQWNCMTSSWQRCAAGRWSAVVDAADGTRCRPAGLSWDLAIDHGPSGAGNGGGGARPTSGALAWGPPGWACRSGRRGRGFSIIDWGLAVAGWRLAAGGWA